MRGAPRAPRCWARAHIPAGRFADLGKPDQGVRPPDGTPASRLTAVEGRGWAGGVRLPAR
jgi:hypothetical protein